MVVVGNDAGNTTRDFLGVVNVKELVGSMSIALRTKHTSDDELSLWELLAQHAHEGDTSSFGNKVYRFFVESCGSLLHTFLQPLAEGRGVPSRPVLLRSEAHMSTMGRGTFEDFFEVIDGRRSVDARWNSHTQFYAGVCSNNVSCIFQGRDSIHSSHGDCWLPGTTCNEFGDLIGGKIRNRNTMNGN